MLFVSSLFALFELVKGGVDLCRIGSCSVDNGVYCNANGNRKVTYLTGTFDANATGLKKYDRDIFSDPTTSPIIIVFSIKENDWADPKQVDVVINGNPTSPATNGGVSSYLEKSQLDQKGNQFTMTLTNSSYNLGDNGGFDIYYYTADHGVTFNYFTWSEAPVDPSDASCKPLQLTQNSFGGFFLKNETSVILGNFTTTLPTGYLDTLVMNATVSYYSAALKKWIPGKISS